jgi:hypothetical protein
MSSTIATSVARSPSRSSSGRKRVRQKSSHRHLLRDESRTPPRHRQPPLNALVVPSARRAGHLEQAIWLAVESETLLVVLASKECRAGDVASQVASTAGCRALVVDVPEHYEHEYLRHEPWANGEFEVLNAGRTSDLSLKRNIGLLLARLLGWHKIMYLDDDIYDVSATQLLKLSSQLDNYQVAGLETRRFPDNSVVCHANRLSGADQDNFVTGAALGVNCADQPLPFFPDVYNEDWFFFLEHAASGALPCVGKARQLEYKPFGDPMRAAREEFGDLLAEGLYALIEAGDGISRATESYWEIFIDARLSLFNEICSRLEKVETNEAFRAVGSVQAARKQASLITPEDCLRFLEAWQEDRRRFQAIVAKLSNLGSYAEAFDHLELKNWYAPEFANRDDSRGTKSQVVSSPVTNP